MIRVSAVLLRPFVIFASVFFVIFTSAVSYAQAPFFDASRTGSLSIIKVRGETDTVEAPLAGVTFKIQKISNINLATQSGWTELNNLTVSEVLSRPDSLESALEARSELNDATTAAAHFADLPLGAYLVQEMPARSGDVSYSVIAPFLVAIPMNTGSNWNYDVVVHAKNQPISITKSASVDFIESGKEFSYKLDGTVPAPDVQGKLHRYQIKDTLPDQVEFNKTDGSVALVIGNNHLQPYSDYEVSYATSSHTVTISFTEHGLAILAAARSQHPELVVHASIKVRVKRDIATATAIDNIAYLFPDGYVPGQHDGIPSNRHHLVVDEKKPGRKNHNDGGLETTTPAISISDNDKDDSSNAGNNSLHAKVSELLNKATKSAPRIGSLAMTGATIFWFICIGVVALLCGYLLQRIGKKKESERDNGRA